MNNNEIIVIKQLPVITEQLQTIKTDVTERVNAALSLACTAETVKEVKAARAELNKEFEFWEGKRKVVKSAILAPYEQFEAVYKDCITDVFNAAKTELTQKIDDVENTLKAEKTEEVKTYFDEYLCSAEIKTGIDLFEWVTFDRANIAVTLSASKKALKEQAKAFIDRVCDDITLIATQGNTAEIMTEYKSTLNASAAITAVVNRHKSIAEDQAKQDERSARAQAEADKMQNVVDAAIKPIAAPVAEPAEVKKIFTLHFTVKGTKTELKALKKFLTNGGYDYE